MAPVPRCGIGLREVQVPGLGGAVGAGRLLFGISGDVSRAAVDQSGDKILVSRVDGDVFVWRRSDNLLTRVTGDVAATTWLDP